MYKEYLLILLLELISYFLKDIFIRFISSLDFHSFCLLLEPLSDRHYHNLALICFISQLLAFDIRLMLTLLLKSLQNFKFFHFLCLIILLHLLLLTDKLCDLFLEMLDPASFLVIACFKVVVLRFKAVRVFYTLR